MACQLAAAHRRLPGRWIWTTRRLAPLDRSRAPGWPPGRESFECPALLAEDNRTPPHRPPPPEGRKNTREGAGTTPRMWFRWCLPAPPGSPGCSVQLFAQDLHPGALIVGAPVELVGVLVDRQACSRSIPSIRSLNPADPAGPGGRLRSSVSVTMSIPRPQNLKDLVGWRESMPGVDHAGQTARPSHSSQPSQGRCRSCPRLLSIGGSFRGDQAPALSFVRGSASPEAVLHASTGIQHLELGDDIGARP